MACAHLNLVNWHYHSIVLHPYYKLTYIQMAWGGLEEQWKELEAGNPNVKDWQDEALQLVEQTMQEYWEDSSISQPGPSTPSASLPHPSTLQSEFNQHHLELIRSAGLHSDSGSWKMELWWYLEDLPKDFSKTTDVVQWWAVHAGIYPTLAQIAKDICATCEQLFSATGEIATDWHSHLGTVKFEHLQVLKHAWWKHLINAASNNLAEVEVVHMAEYEELLIRDAEMVKWEDGSDIDIVTL